MAGWADSRCESVMSQHDVNVIGAGPGGYVTAIRAARLGLGVV